MNLQRCDKIISMVKEGPVPCIYWTFPVMENDYEVARANFKVGAGATEGQDVVGLPLVRIHFRIRRRTKDTAGRPMLPSRNN